MSIEFEPIWLKLRGFVGQILRGEDTKAITAMSVHQFRKRIRTLGDRSRARSAPGVLTRHSVSCLVWL